MAVFLYPPAGSITISGVATETTLAALLAELQLKADLTETQPVSVSSMPLPSGAATSANQATQITSLNDLNSELDIHTTKLTSLDGKDFATQTTLAALLTELQLKADLTETQPVSAASLPLPSGASTASNQTTTHTKLDSLLTELQLKADLTETQPVSAASLPLPSGASTASNQTTTHTKLDSLLTELQLKADLTETQPVSISTLPAGTNNIGDVDVLSLPSIPAGTNNIGDVDVASLPTFVSDRLAGSLVPSAFDYIALTYVPSGNGVGEVSTAVYKTGGSGGTTVATLTLAYDGSNKLTSVTKT